MIHKLAKIGILCTNISIGIAAVLLMSVMTSFMGLIGFILGAFISIVSCSVWFIICSAYSKLMEKVNG